MYIALITKCFTKTKSKKQPHADKYIFRGNIYFLKKKDNYAFIKITAD